MQHNLLKNVKILYVEDDALLRRYLTVFLKTQTDNLYLAEDGTQGYELFLKHKPDLIITDIQMPEMDGLTMSEKIKSKDKNIPIIVTTAFNEEEYLIKSIHLKIDYYVKKPIVISELEETLSKISKIISNKKEIEIKNSILDSIDDGVITVDENFIIGFANNGMEKISGFEKKSLVGLKCCDVFDKSICGNICPISKSFQNNKSYYISDRPLKKKNGLTAQVSIHTGLLKDSADINIGCVVTFKDLTAVNALTRELASKYSYMDIISKNSAIMRIFEVIRDISETDVTVLLTGETGTGKELFVNAVHNLSQRKDGPLIKVNCAALPENLLESEIFGYKKGAFTDARADKKGRVESAEGGTLFLDEIGEIPLSLQVKLLRLIQEKEYDALGSTHTSKADIRIITATNRNLKDMVAKKIFREDLYYRLNIIHFELPPLRNRAGDLPLLIDHFISKFNFKYKKAVKNIDEIPMNLLMNYSYPGNIRELENIIEHSVILCKSDNIEEKHLPVYFIEGISRQKKNIEKNSLEIIEKKITDEELLNALKKNNMDRNKTATELGIHRATLWRRLKKIIAPE